MMAGSNGVFGFTCLKLDLFVMQLVALNYNFAYFSISMYIAIGKIFIYDDMI